MTTHFIFRLPWILQIRNGKLILLRHFIWTYITSWHFYCLVCERSNNILRVDCCIYFEVVIILLLIAGVFNNTKLQHNFRVQFFGGPKHRIKNNKPDSDFSARSIAFLLSKTRPCWLVGRPWSAALHSKDWWVPPAIAVCLSQQLVPGGRGQPLRRWWLMVPPKCQIWETLSTLPGRKRKERNSVGPAVFLRHQVSRFLAKGNIKK